MVVFFFAILQSPLRTQECVNLLFLVHENTLYLVVCAKGDLNFLLHNFRLRPPCK